MTLELERQLRGDEDTRSCVYPDSRGFWTIGTGRLVDDRISGAGLRPVEMEFMLQNDIKDRTEALLRILPWFAQLGPARQGVLLNMSFQLGVMGLMKFVQTLKYVKQGNYVLASDSMEKSLWATQTPERCKRMAKQMKTGIWQYAK